MILCNIRTYRHMYIVHIAYIHTHIHTYASYNIKIRNKKSANFRLFFHVHGIWHRKWCGTCVSQNLIKNAKQCKTCFPWAWYFFIAKNRYMFDLFCVPHLFPHVWKRLHCLVVVGINPTLFHITFLPKICSHGKQA